MALIIMECCGPNFYFMNHFEKGSERQQSPRISGEGGKVNHVQF